MHYLKVFANTITDRLMVELNIPVRTTYTWIEGKNKGVGFRTFSCIGKEQTLIGELKFPLSECSRGIYRNQDQFDEIIKKYKNAYKWNLLFNYDDTEIED